MSSKREATETRQKGNTEWWCVDLGQGAAVDPEVFERLTESFLRFTPDLVQGRNRIFLEMGRTKKLFNLSAVSARIRILGERLGLDTGHWRFGIGKTLPAAWIQTRWRTLLPEALPLDAYHDYLDPLTHFEMNRPMRERIDVFRALGMRHLASLFTVPKSAWLVRFGEEFDRFLENYEFGETFVWSAYRPTASLGERSRWNAEDTVIDAEGLIFRLKPLIDRLMERLHALGRSLKKVEVVLKLDRPVPDRKLLLAFAFPQTSRVLLLKLLRERITREMERESLTDPVVEAEIIVLETGRRERGSERFSFSEQDEKNQHERERWVELVSYLGLKLECDGKVFQAETTEHLLPEKSWKKVLLADPVADQPLDRVSQFYSKRPLRLFHEPEVLHRVGPYLRRAGVLWKICDISEPERLAGHDWDVDGNAGRDGGFDRVYYRVRVEGGGTGTAMPFARNGTQKQTQEWWIYKDERAGSLNLHGVY
jgi:hypothetical protein